MKTWKTPKGTELVISNIRGADYLEVKWRLVWFREDHPDWAIETQFLMSDPGYSFVQASIYNADGRRVAMAHKFEDKQGFHDHKEKCETGAIGRALALLGYGTQFCADELDEGHRLADAPVAQLNHGEKQKAPARTSGQANPGPDVAGSSPVVDSSGAATTGRKDAPASVKGARPPKPDQKEKPAPVRDSGGLKPPGPSERVKNLLVSSQAKGWLQHQIKEYIESKFGKGVLVDQMSEENYIALVNTVSLCGFIEAMGFLDEGK